MDETIYAADILREAAKLLTKNAMPGDPAVRRADALNADNIPCFVTDPRAKRFSIMGALLLTSRKAEWDELAIVVNEIARAIGVVDPDINEDSYRIYQAIWKWEDTPRRTVDDIVAVLIKAREGVPDGKQAKEETRRRTRATAAVG